MAGANAIEVSDEDPSDAFEAPWAWADGCRTKKRRGAIHPDKLALYARYTEPKTDDVKRLWVNEAGHEWMRKELEQWQMANGKSKRELPFENEWFFDKRVEGIDKGYLTKQHSPKVIKSYLMTVVDAPLQNDRK